MAQNRTLVCRGEAIPEVERLELLNLVRMRRHRFKEPGLGLSLVLGLGPAEKERTVSMYCVHYVDHYVGHG